MEIWKDIEGYEGLYQVSDMGRVKSLNYHRTGKEKVRKLSRDKDGYCLVTLHKNGNGITKKVHRLVAQAFIPNPDNLPKVCHKDDNPVNNIVTNLFWGTSRNNTDDMVSKGRQAKGLNHGMCILTIEQVIAIKKIKLETGWGARNISRELGLKETAVRSVVENNNWKHVK